MSYAQRSEDAENDAALNELRQARINVFGPPPLSDFRQRDGFVWQQKGDTVKDWVE